MGSFKFLDWLLVLAVMSLAASARIYYVHKFAAGGDADSPAIRHVQAEPPANETVPAASPAYSISKDFVQKQVEERLSGKVTPVAAVRWLQVLLGALTAGLYFGLGRRAFGSRLVGFLAGLFVAFNPFAIINVAELQDGTLTSFLLAFALASGARAGQRGGAVTSALFGLSLAGLTLVRLALAPFALITLAWFLFRSARVKGGWLSAILAFLCFAGAVGSWMGHNYQQHQNPLPIVDSLWWHVWLGNNEHATGGPQDGDVADLLGGEKADNPLAPPVEPVVEPAEGVPNEKPLKPVEAPKAPAKVNHDDLAAKVMDEVKAEPFKTVERRLIAGLHFFTGKADGQRDGLMTNAVEEQPDPRLDFLPDALYCTLFGMLFLAVIGFRWSYAWRLHTMPLQLAVFWIPLPYILSHAELLHGPRLPLDGVLLTLSAFTLCCLLPGLGGRLRNGKLPPSADQPEKPPAPKPARM
jgi:4-amino-4-deoxy-L-arabinose transferase-like glycosyltransferase